MQHSLTSLFTSIAMQPPVDRPAARAAARDRAVPALPGQDKDREHEFQLPREPRDRVRGPERSRSRSDEPRESSETRRSDNAREAPPRREDPPRRSDPQRGVDQARDGEPPRRLDPPGRARRAEGEPSRAEEAEASPADKVLSGQGEAVTEPAAEGAVPEASTETTVAEAAADGASVIIETLLDPEAIASPAAATSATAPQDQTVIGPALVNQVAAGMEASPLDGEPTGTLDGMATAPATETPETPTPQTAVAAVPATSEDGDLPIEEGDGSETGEGLEAAGLPVPDAPLPEQAQAAVPAEQAATAATGTAGPALPAAASPTAQQHAVAHGAPASAQALEGIGAKTTYPQDKPVTAHERAELRDQNARTEAGKSAQGIASAADAGTTGKAPVKAEQPLPTAFEPTAGGHSSPAASLNTPAGPAASTATTPNAPIRVVTEVPLGAVPVEIGLKSLAGVNHFEIRLDPAELGRIEVRLDIDEEGGVKAHLTVDKVETLALLQRDSRSLERAFEQAGLKPTDGSVDLSLRDGQSQSQGRQEHGGEQRREAPHMRGDQVRETIDPALAETPRRGWRGAAGVDVLV
jgi:flagellar hook-length control protein FliK